MGRWRALIILGTAQFLMVLDTSVMNVSISRLVEDFDTEVTTIQTVITLYTLVMAAFMITGGKSATCSDAAVCPPSDWSCTAWAPRVTGPPSPGRPRGQRLQPTRLLGASPALPARGPCWCREGKEGDVPEVPWGSHSAAAVTAGAATSQVRPFSPVQLLATARSNF